VLYGRSEDVAALRDLIRHHALVTVVGPAGIGKTRLAQAVAHELVDEFADGVRPVELAPLADPDLVAATVARALGLAVGDPHTALDLTVQALASQRLLLVLDNCEHLLAAVTRWSRRCARVRRACVLAHSGLLRHADENVYG
jgi:predicted ATPase